MEDENDHAAPEPMRGISLEVILDAETDYIVEIEVRASNGRFTGTTRYDGGRECFARLATTLSGFPTSRADRREVDLHDIGTRRAGRRVFHCATSGHAFVAVELAERVCETAATDSAAFSIAVEPAAIDRFVAKLRAARVARGVVVVLPARD